ncbi:MAG: mTERF [Marteilia pararefringens]
MPPPLPSLQQFQRLCYRNDSISSGLLQIGFSRAQCNALCRSYPVRFNKVHASQIVQRSRHILHHFHPHLELQQLIGVTLSFPKLLLSAKGPLYALQCKMLLSDRLGLDISQTSKILCKAPKILTKRAEGLAAAFELMKDQMQFEMQDIISNGCKALELVEGELQQRHEFLQSIGKNQYDKNLPLFVSLEVIGKSRLKDFVEAIGETEENYMKFLKTI